MTFPTSLPAARTPDPKAAPRLRWGVIGTGWIADEARQIASAAQAAGVFCMEAYWTAFLPKFDVLRQLLENQALGERLTVVADFGEWFADDHRILRPELAGGPLLDLGTYLTAFALDALGPTETISAQGQWVPTGVLGQVGAILTHRGGSQSVLHTTLRSNTPTTAVIAGSEGTLVLDGPFYQPGGFTLTSSVGDISLRYEEKPVSHEALHFQAAEVARRIDAGETGSPLRPLTDSIATLEVLDRIAAACR